MLNQISHQLNNMGDELYRSWSREKRQEEIGKLVEGYKNGLPVQIMCQLSVSIAGGASQAKEHLAAFLTRRERKEIIRNAGPDQALRSLLEATLR